MKNKKYKLNTFFWVYLLIVDTINKHPEVCWAEVISTALFEYPSDDSDVILDSVVAVTVVVIETSGAGDSAVINRLNITVEYQMYLSIKHPWINPPL